MPGEGVSVDRPAARGPAGPRAGAAPDAVTAEPAAAGSRRTSRRGRRRPRAAGPGAGPRRLVPDPAGVGGGGDRVRDRQVRRSATRTRSSRPSAPGSRSGSPPTGRCGGWPSWPSASRSGSRSVTCWCTSSATASGRSRSSCSWPRSSRGSSTAAPMLTTQAGVQALVIVGLPACRATGGPARAVDRRGRSAVRSRSRSRCSPRATPGGTPRRSPAPRARSWPACSACSRAGCAPGRRPTCEDALVRGRASPAGARRVVRDRDATPASWPACRRRSASTARSSPGSSATRCSSTARCATRGCWRGAAWPRSTRGRTT